LRCLDARGLTSGRIRPSDLHAADRLVEMPGDPSCPRPSFLEPGRSSLKGVPASPVVRRCFELLWDSAEIPAEIFRFPEALGWASQYWNSEEKDRVFNRLRTEKGAKIEGAAVIPATQLYTEPYMVRFLVQNSLGAIWRRVNPESELYREWAYH